VCDGRLGAARNSALLSTIPLDPIAQLIGPHQYSPHTLSTLIHNLFPSQQHTPKSFTKTHPNATLNTNNNRNNIENIETDTN
jgi:hypothetical protein